LIPALFSQKLSSISGLTAPANVEGGMIQHHPLVYHLSHRGLELFYIAVILE
jgi:hypothetical protein